MRTFRFTAEGKSIVYPKLTAKFQASDSYTAIRTAENIVKGINTDFRETAYRVVKVDEV